MYAEYRPTCSHEYIILLDYGKYSKLLLQMLDKSKN